MNKNKFTIIFLIILIINSVCAFSQNIKASETPQVNAEGMNLNSFGSVNAGVVDLGSGAFTFSRTDITIPGRNGMNLSVGRSYNSKEFNASPKWSKLDGDAYYNYAGDDLIKIQWQAATPAQWGGWIGKGWKTNISGRLLHIKFENTYKRTDWYGAVTKYDTHSRTDIVIIQLGGGSYSFEKTESDPEYKTRDKGSKQKLIQNVSGFVLMFEDGRQYTFKENYYNKKHKIALDIETNFRSVHERHRVADYVSTP